MNSTRMFALCCAVLGIGTAAAHSQSLIAGYMDTRIDSGMESQVNLVAIGDLPPAPLLIWHEGIPTGLTVPYAGGGVWSMQLPVRPAEAGRMLLELRQEGNGASQWPSLNVTTSPPVPAGGNGVFTPGGPSAGVNVAVEPRLVPADVLRLATGERFETATTRTRIDGQPYAGFSDVVLRKFDSAGGVLWTRVFGTPGADEARNLVALPEGRVGVFGFTSGDLNGQTAPGSGDVFLAAFTGDGASMFTALTGTGELESPGWAAATPSGEISLCGTTFGRFNGQSGGNGDAFLARLNPDGTLAGVIQWGSGGADYPRRLAVKTTGEIIVAGETSGALGGEALGGFGDAFVSAFGLDLTPRWTRQTGTPGYDSLDEMLVTEDGTVRISTSEVRMLGRVRQKLAGGSEFVIAGDGMLVSPRLVSPQD